MKSTYKAFRKILIFIVGTAVLIVGFILVPLPGPGLLVMAGGLLILSSEFEWAERRLKNIRSKIHGIYEQAKSRRLNQKDKEKASKKEK